MNKEIIRKSFCEQAALVRSGEISAQELTDAAISEIERLNPTLNAVTIPLFDYAQQQLNSLSGDEPYGGVPFLLKDMIAELAGTEITEGSRFLRGHVSAHDSELVARYRRAGLIFVGKTNTPEYASKPTTEPLVYGPTKNPWDLTLSPAGSSGGSAAAVAAGMVSAGHANDGGGSIRLPAAWNGLVGLKPTRGRNPLGPDYGDLAAGLVCEHVVTRTVADTAALLDITHGPQAGDPYLLPIPHRSYLDETKNVPRKLRIAFSDVPITPTTVHEDCRNAVHEAAKLCEDLGHHVEESKPDVQAPHFNDFFTTIWLAMVAWAIRDWSRRTGREPREQDFEPHTWKMFCLDEKRKPSDLLLAVQDMHKFAREVAPFFDRYDVWLTPTATEPPQALGYFDTNPDFPRRATERMENVPRFTAVANATGQPAMSLPLSWNNEGLPIGVQIMGRFADEATLFQLAAQLEQSSPWHDRWPGLE
ncbi:MAG: amidase [Gammaproteobacteria bacterium]